MIVDIHTHTNIGDGIGTPEDVVKRAKAIGLGGIAITDHDDVKGSLIATRHQSKDFVVIPGIEFSAQEGHILCLGTTDIPERYLGGMRKTDARVPAAEILDLASDLGAIAIAAHPYDKFRRGVGDLVYKAKFDAIEIINGHTIANRKDPKKVADELGMVKVGGSDAHGLNEIGNVCIEVDGEPLEAIRTGRLKIVAKNKISLLTDLMKSGIVKAYFKGE